MLRRFLYLSAAFVIHRPIKNFASISTVFVMLVPWLREHPVIEPVRLFPIEKVWKVFPIWFLSRLGLYLVRYLHENIPVTGVVRFPSGRIVIKQGLYVRQLR